MKTLRVWLSCWVALCASVGVHAQQANTFNIFEYRVEGSTLLPTRVVEKAVYPFLGEQRSYNDVEAARTALEKAYHDAGYLTVLVTVPEQKVSDATVRLSVVEAAVSRLRVTDSRYFSLGEIKAAVPALQEGSVPQFGDVQDQMGEVNRSTDRRVTPVLRPGRESGTVEADLKVEDTYPLHGTFDLNNRNNEGTSPTRASASVHWDNLWSRLHSFGVTLQTAPEKTNDSQVLSLNYSAPLGGGETLTGYVVHSESDVAVVDGVDTIGNGDIYGVRYLIPLLGDAGFYHSLTLGADYKNFKQSVRQVGSGGFNTPIQYLPGTVGWDAGWTAPGHDARFGVSFNFQWPGVFSSDAEFADKRYKGYPGYSYLKGNFSRKDSVIADWTFEVRGSWQYATQALISNEQFSIGGADTVRGYYESAATGENGVALTLEAATPNFIHDKTASVRDLHLVVFADAAQVSVIDPLFATSNFQLASNGVGLRLSGPRGLSLSVDWAVALNSIGTTHAGDNRAGLRVIYDW